MADFLIAHRRTDKFEGGYQAIPSDNGNWTGGKQGVGKLIGTNRGITASELQAYLGRTITVDDMKNLSEVTALAIYRVNYWNRIKGDQINDQSAANDIYDSSVNNGVGTAIMLAQRALGIEETKVMDTRTLKLLNNEEE